MIEIERKFLVNSDQYKKSAQRKLHIKQGYISAQPERTVRVRIKGESGYLTIKGKSSESGMSRFEWETEITLNEAHQLFALCEEGVIEKFRYEIPIGNHTIEVDEFVGDNVGLIIAEVELYHESEKFEKPEWLGAEVTNDERYYNAYLSKYPFKMWRSKDSK